MDFSLSLPTWARHALIGLGLFLLGGLVAFGYSWRPLHGALSWKVAALEEKLDARNLENLKLADELARLRSQDAGRVEPEAFAKVEQALAKTESALSQAEKDLKRADRKRRDANASASRWRKRYEILRDEQASMPAAPTPAEPAAPADTPTTAVALEGPAPTDTLASPAAPETGILGGDASTP